MGFPLRKAPQCLLAEKNCLIRGLYIIPISTFLFTANAKEMHVCGKRCTKLVVPSIGSIIHVGSSVSSGRQPSFAAVSSPINLKDWILLQSPFITGLSLVLYLLSVIVAITYLCDGNCIDNCFINLSSILRSYSVTRSQSMPLLLTFFLLLIPSSITYKRWNFFLYVSCNFLYQCSFYREKSIFFCVSCVIMNIPRVFLENMEFKEYDQLGINFSLVKI